MPLAVAGSTPPLRYATPRRQPLILNEEDGDGDTIRPRLPALGAGLERVSVPDRVRDSPGQPLSFPAHISFLDDALRRTDARLVVIDPIVAFLDLSGVNSGGKTCAAPCFLLPTLPPGTPV